MNFLFFFFLFFFFFNDPNRKAVGRAGLLLTGRNFNFFQKNGPTTLRNKFSSSRVPFNPNVCAVHMHDVKVLPGLEILMTICALKIQTRRSCCWWSARFFRNRDSFFFFTRRPIDAEVFSSQMFSIIMPESPLFFVFLNHCIE